MLNVLEIDDPKLSVVIHLMSQMEPIEPMLHSPMSLPLVKQNQLANALLAEMACTKMATEGMLLSNLEKNCTAHFQFSYLLYTNCIILPFARRYLYSERFYCL